MKRVLVIYIVLFYLQAFTACNGQQGGTLYNKGSVLTIKNSSLCLHGNFVNSSRQNDALTINGEIQSKAGTVKLKGDFINETANMVFRRKAGGTVVFDGNGVQSIFGDSIRFGSLEVDNPIALIIETSLLQVENEFKLTQGLVNGNRGVIDLIDSSHITGERSDREISGLGSIQALERSKGLALQEIGGTGLYVGGSTGSVSVHRYHVTPQAGERAYSRLFHYSAVNTADVTVGFRYLYDSFEANFAIYYSTDSIRWTRVNSPATNPNENYHTGLAPGFKDGWIALANSDCDNPPTITITPENPSFCTGDSVTFGIVATNDRLLWSNGSTRPTITVGQAGDYQLTRIADNGCMDAVAVQVRERELPQAAFEPATSSACQQQEISFENQSTADDAIQQTVWVFGDGDVSLLSSPNHRYTSYGPKEVRLIVTTEFGCRDTAMASILVHPNPQASFAISNNCENEWMQALSTSSIVPMVATIPYAINAHTWYLDGDTIADEVSMSLLLEDTTAFELKLVVSSNTTCVDSVREIIHIAPAPVAGFSVNPFCQDELVTLLNTSENANMFEWYLGDSLLSNDNEPNIQIDTFGLIALNLVASNQRQCADTLSQSITIFERPKVQFMANDTCAGLPLTIVDSSVYIEPVQYQWNFGDSSFSDQQGPIKYFEHAGTYSIQLTLRSNEGCIDSAFQSVNVHHFPQIAFSADTVCTGKTSTVTNLSAIDQGTISSLWVVEQNDTLTTGDLRYRFATEGEHQLQLTVLSEFGCRDDSTFLVHTLHTPTLDLGDEIQSCHDSLLLDFSGLDYQFLWTTGDTTRQLLITSDGLYGLQLTSAERCVGGDTTLVVLDVQQSAGLGSDTLVCDSITLDVFQFNSAYLWSTGDTSAHLTVTTSGTYHVQRTAFDGCVSYDTIALIVAITPVFNLDSLYEACSGDTVWLNTGLSELQHIWSINNTLDSASIAIVQSNIIDVQVKGDGGCTAYDTTQVRIYDYPQIALGDDVSVCDSHRLQLRSAPDTWQWSNGSSDSNLFVNNSGTYWLSATNANLCTSVDSIQIAIINSPTSFLDTIETRCAGFTRRLNAGLADYYLWSTGDTTQHVNLDQDDTLSIVMNNGNLCYTYDTVIVQFVAIPTPALDSNAYLCGVDTLVLNESVEGFQTIWYKDQRAIELGNELVVIEPGSYVLEWNDGFDCSVYDTINVYSVEGVVADFTSSSVAEVGDTIQFVQITTPEASLYSWDFGDGITDTTQHPLHQYFISGNYQVTLAVSLGSCSSSITQPITIYNDGESPIDLDVDSVSLVQIVRAGFYPSPFERELNAEIELSEVAELHLYLYNSMGEAIWYKNYSLQQLQEIYNFGDLEPGAYTLYVISNQSIKTIKLIKI